MGFCTRCGASLEPGQVCDCTIRSASSGSEQSDTPMRDLTSQDYTPGRERPSQDYTPGRERPSQDYTLGRDRSPQGYISLKNRMGIGDVERNATDCYERGQPIIPAIVKPTEGEIPVKQYNIAVLRTLLKFERAEGRMQITNKRLVFRAPGRSIGGRTTLQHEYSINEIAGIEARKNYRFSLLHMIGGYWLISLTFPIGYFLTKWVSTLAEGLGIILGLLFGAAGVIAFFMVPKDFIFKLAVLGVSLGGIFLVVPLFNPLAYFLLIITLFCLFLHFMRPNLIISIKNKMGSGEGPADIRRKTIKSDSTGFAEVMPTEEAEGAIREIGAIIKDIQTSGDLGLQKWMSRK